MWRNVPTDTFEKPKPPYKVRKTRYIEGIKNKSKSAQLVSLADKIHNARAIKKDYQKIQEKVWDRFNGTRDEVLWYYNELVSQFKSINNSEHKELYEELEGIIDELNDMTKYRK